MKNLFITYKIKLLYIFISVLTILFSFLNFSTNHYTPLAIAITIELIVFLLVMRKINKTIIDFSTIYIIILFIFHFGQVILLGLLEEKTRSNQLRIVLDYIPVHDCVKAFRLINIAFVMICYGILFKTHKIYKNNKKQLNHNYQQYYNQAILIIIFSFPIKLIIDFIFLKISFYEGFVAGRTWYSMFPDIFKTFGNFSIIGFGLLLVILKNKSKKQNLLMMGIVIYFLLLMSSGRRSENVAYLCVFVFLYLQSNIKKITLKKFIFWIVLGFFMLGFLFNIVKIRDIENMDISIFCSNFLENIINNNVLLQVLREYGNTGYTAACVLCFWLIKFPPSIGKSYILGISAIFPNFCGIMGELSTKSSFTLQLQNQNALAPAYQNIGGSFIGELFFNFGYLGGIIWAFIFGILIGHVCSKIREYMNLYKYDRLIYYIPIATALLYWVRDTFHGGIREIVWGIIFCKFVQFICKVRS